MRKTWKTECIGGFGFPALYLCTSTEWWWEMNPFQAKVEPNQNLFEIVNKVHQLALQLSVQSDDLISIQEKIVHLICWQMTWPGLGSSRRRVWDKVGAHIVSMRKGPKKLRSGSNEGKSAKGSFAVRNGSSDPLQNSVRQPRTCLEFVPTERLRSWATPIPHWATFTRTTSKMPTLQYFCSVPKHDGETLRYRIPDACCRKLLACSETK